MPSIQPIQKKAFLSHVLFNQIRGHVDHLFVDIPNSSLVVEDKRRRVHGFSEIQQTHEIMADWLSNDTGQKLQPDDIFVDLEFNGAVMEPQVSDHVRLLICLYDNSPAQWPVLISPIKTIMPDPRSAVWKRLSPRPNQVIIWDQSTHWGRRLAFDGTCNVSLNLTFSKI